MMQISFNFGTKTKKKHIGYSLQSRLAHDAIQFGHVGNAHIDAWTIAWFWFSICVNTSCLAFWIRNECIHFISRFHDLTFRCAWTGAVIYRRTTIGHLAFHLRPSFWKAAHVQQRKKTKHWLREIFEIIICVYVHFFSFILYSIAIKIKSYCRL